VTKVRGRAAQMAAEAILEAAKGNPLTLRFPARGRLLSARKRLFSIRRELEQAGDIPVGSVVICTRLDSLEIELQPRAVKKVGGGSGSQPHKHTPPCDPPVMPVPAAVPSPSDPFDIDPEQAELLSALKDQLLKEAEDGD